MYTLATKPTVFRLVLKSANFEVLLCYFVPLRMRMAAHSLRMARAAHALRMARAALRMVQ